MVTSNGVNGTVASAFQARFGAAPGAEAAESERPQWEQLCRELLEERDRLRDELRKTKQERDLLRSAMCVVTPDMLEVTAEAAQERLSRGPTIDQLLADLDAKVQVEAPGPAR